MTTIIQQGSFTSDGKTKDLDIRSDVDAMEVINFTQMGTQQTPGRGVKFQWQRGLAPGAAIEFTKADGADTLQGETVSSGGFTLLPEAASSPVTGTTITKATPPVCTAANHGFSNGDQVSLSNLTNMPQIAVVVFTIGNVTTNTFELSFFDTNTANFVAETAFKVTKLRRFDWTNSWNIITSITSGVTTQVQLSSNENTLSYDVGDVLKFNVTSEFGMIQIDGLTGEVLSVVEATNTYTIDLDSTSFSAFSWPASSAVPMELPHINSVGTNSTSVEGATKNTAFIGIGLGAGIDGPAGSTGDLILWKATKSSLITTE